MQFIFQFRGTAADAEAGAEVAVVNSRKYIMQINSKRKWLNSTSSFECRL